LVSYLYRADSSKLNGEHGLVTDYEHEFTTVKLDSGKEVKVDFNKLRLTSSSSVEPHCGSAIEPQCGSALDKLVSLNLLKSTFISLPESRLTVVNSCS
jgi:hypothetical protein